jgi:hypothetical protein
MQDSLLFLEVCNTLFLESLVSKNLAYPVSRPRDSKLRKIKLGFPAAKEKGVQKTGGSREAGKGFVTYLLFVPLSTMHASS